MIFTETKLKGAYIIELEKLEDERGFFARTWDQKLFEKYGLNSNFVQSSISFNKKKGTFRGMHYQDKPYEECKLVRCTRGKIFDVIIDLRPESKTFKDWFGIELSEDNHMMLYIPEGLAHGFETLENDTEVFYQISVNYMENFAKRIRWNDQGFNIKWPIVPQIISDSDRSAPNFD